jgi:hypothetical protein
MRQFRDQNRRHESAACLRWGIAMLLFGWTMSVFTPAAIAQAPSLKQASSPKKDTTPAGGKAPVTTQQMADYRKKLAEYTTARQKFEDEAGPYWASITAKRKARSVKRNSGQAIVLEDYVLTQPPSYTGPQKPVDPSAIAPAKPPKALPVVADFLASALEQFQFEPRKPGSEIEFKKAYAKVAAAAGLTGDQAARIYGFEAGGNGKYDVQAGLEYDKPGAHAISTALGYNQLLTTNSVELLAEQGDQFVKNLKDRAAGMTGAQKAEMQRKISTLQTMISFSRSVPDQWGVHERLGTTAKGLGIHALNLDLDVGPLLQTQKLMNSVIFAKAKGYGTPLTAAELEMMNLTGDGNGFDMISMPQAVRSRVPTSNFFARSGYERNPVAIRNNVVSALLAAADKKMDTEVELPGAKDLAAVF